MTEFKVGDIVRQSAGCGSVVKDKDWEVRMLTSSMLVIGVNGSTCTCYDKWMLVSKTVEKDMSNLTKLTEIQEANITPELKALVEVGLLTNTGELNSQTKLNNMLVKLNFKALAKEAMAEVEKIKAEEAKAKTA